MTTNETPTSSTQHPITLPSALAVAKDIAEAHAGLDWNLIRESARKHDGPEDMEIRLRCVPLMTRGEVAWSIKVGDPSFDTDHSGYWSASSMVHDQESFGGFVSLAIELLEQVADAMGEDNIETVRSMMEVEIEDMDEVVTEDGLLMSQSAAEAQGIAFEGQCVLWADAWEAANDRAVLGSTWECLNSPGAYLASSRAYAIVSGDVDSVRARLRAQGYRTVG